MKLNLTSLEDKKAWEGYKLFNYNHKKIEENTKARPQWIHFGAGNIFRIFPAGLCQKLLNEGLMDTGIVVGEGFDGEIIDKIYAPHDNLTLGVTLKANGTIEKEVIGSVMEAVKCDPNSQNEWSVLESAFTNPSLQMVSFTITEKGYALYQPDGNLFKFYVSDFEKPLKDASMFLCRLTRLLNDRFNSCKSPIALVSMDNCSHNGEKLRNAITTIAKTYQEKGELTKEFVEWVSNEDCVSFPWSMIDKITPRPDQSVANMLKETGFEDTEAIITSKNTYIAPFVNAEEPQYLVIEDRFPNGRPALEKSGVYLTDRDTVNKVEKMKVCTCLNPLHTALAVYGCLLGYDKISEEMKDAELVKLVETIGYVEGLPVVVNPGVLDPKEFIDTVLKVRIPNPFMPDTPQRIATDTSQKLAIRFGETIKNYIASPDKNVADLKLIPLVFSGWLRYLMAVDDEGNKFELSPDPLLDTVCPYVADIKFGDTDVEAKIKPVLENAKIFGVNLYEAGLADLVCKYFTELIAGKGAVRETLKKYTR